MQERQAKHHDEVDEQGNRDPQYVERQPHDGLSLEGEHHDDGEEQGYEGNGTDAGHEDAFEPLAPLHSDEPSARDKPCGKGNPEVDTHALGDLADADVDDRPFQVQPGREHRGEEVGIGREEEHLEDRVERDEPGAVFGVPLGEIVPNDDHRDTTSEADEDEAEHVLGLVTKKHHREREHQEGADEPVLHEG